MTKTKRRDSGEGDGLRDLLRRGDPAAGVGRPGPAEVARMREAILAAAAAAPRGRFGPAAFPKLAATALAAAAVLAVVAWIARRGPVAALPPEPAVASGQWTPAEPEPLLEPAEGAFAPRPVVAAAIPQRIAPPEASVAPSAPRATTVRFTTQRGTQIIWTLDPRIEL